MILENFLTSYKSDVVLYFDVSVYSSVSTSNRVHDAHTTNSTTRKASRKKLQVTRTSCFLFSFLRLSLSFSVSPSYSASLSLFPYLSLFAAQECVVENRDFKKRKDLKKWDRELGLEKRK